MAEPENAQRRANTRIIQAKKSKSRGDLEKGLELINEAISLAEKEGLDPYPDKVQRELLILDSLQTKDFSGLISVTTEQMNDARYRENVILQIDLRLTLAGLLIFSRDFQQSRTVLDEVERLLSSTPLENISQSLANVRGFSSRDFVELRQAEVVRLRQYLTGQE